MRRKNQPFAVVRCFEHSVEGCLDNELICVNTYSRRRFINKLTETKLLLR